MIAKNNYKMLVALGLCTALMACSNDESAETAMDEATSGTSSAISSGMDSASSMADDAMESAQAMATEAGAAAGDMADEAMAAAGEMADEAEAAATAEANAWADKQKADGMDKMKQKAAELMPEK